MQLTDSVDFLQQTFRKKLEQTNNNFDAQQQKKVLFDIVSLIVDKLDDVSVSSVEGSISIDNLDVVQATLKNELNKLSNSLLKILQSINTSTVEQNKLLKKLDQPQLDTIKVENLKEIEFPSDVKVNNLGELSQFFNSLEQTIISSFKIDIAPPEVNVNVPPQAIPQINIPETIINFPKIDFNPIIQTLETHLNKIRTNDAQRPLAVRLTDGQKWINRLEAIVQEQKQAFAAFPGAIKIVNADGHMVDFNTIGGSTPTSIGDGSKTVTTAGTEVQLSATSVPCKYVIITANAANTGNIYVGGSTIDSTRGRPLISLQSEKLDINNLNKVYIDADTNGEGVTYVYVV